MFDYHNISKTLSEFLLIDFYCRQDCRDVRIPCNTQSYLHKLKINILQTRNVLDVPTVHYQADLVTVACLRYLLIFEVLQ